MKKLYVRSFGAPVLSLDIATGSDLCAVALAGRRVVIWDLASNAPGKQIEFPPPSADPHLKLDSDHEPLRVRFSPTGEVLAVSFLSRVYLYQAGSWLLLHSVGVEGEDTSRPLPPESVEPRPRLKERPAPGQPPETRLNELFKREYQREALGDGRVRITAVRFTPSDMLLVAYCRGGCYDTLWAYNTAPAIFPILSAGDPVRLWNTKTGAMLWQRVLDPHGLVRGLAVSPNGRVFAAAIAHHAQPGAVGLYRLDTGTLVAPLDLALSLFDYGAPPLVFSPGGRVLITGLPGTWKKQLRLSTYLSLFDGATGERVGDFSGHQPIGDADASGNGETLVTSTANGVALYVWDVGERRMLARALPSWTRSIHRVRISPDGRFVVALDVAGRQAFVYRLGAAPPD